MADIRESFPTLEDGTGAGVCATASLVGDSPSGKVFMPTIMWKDSSGNLAIPQLTAQGRIPVDTEQVVGTIKRARGTVSAGSLTATNVATLSLTATKKYSDISFIVSCRKDAFFQIVQNDNGSQTVLYDVILGPGQLSFQCNLHVDQFTAGTTGTQQLLVVGNNFSTQSALYATVTCVETT